MKEPLQPLPNKLTLRIDLRNLKKINRKWLEAESNDPDFDPPRLVRGAGSLW